MKKSIVLIQSLIFSLLLMAQSPPDSDGDGISDSEDVCPFTKGTKASKGCPEAVQPPSCNYIRKINLEAVLSAVCSNTVNRKVKAKLENNKSLLTDFPKNGTAQNLPVYYKQTKPDNYTLTLGLSNRLADTTAILDCINSFFRESAVFNGQYKRVQLTYTPSSKRYSDVYASDGAGLFFYLENIKSAGKYLVQLRIVRITYNETPQQTPVKTPPPPVNECGDFEKILNECISGYTGVKGSFVKEEVPAKYYNTSLPALGLADKFVVESINVEISNGQIGRKNVIYYSAEKEFTKNDEAILVFEQLKNRLRKCYSGTVNITDDKNQKIYELFFTYKGYNLRAVVIYLNFFSSNVSISFRIADK